MDKRKVNVVIDDDYAGRFDSVVKRLVKAGLNVEQKLKAVGLVSGTIDADKLPDLERVKGVGSVEREREFNLPPPDSDIQAIDD
jgi:hypothetical protein